jgi:hypothetical protein
LKIAILIGPDIREFGSRVPSGFDRHELLWYVDGVVTFIPTKTDTITAKVTRFEQPAFSSFSMYEDVRYDYKGRMQTNSFMQYKIPARNDIKNIHVVFEESYEPTGPFGAKSVGEVVVNTPSPAIAHAVYNATGAWMTKLPITPEKLFIKMRK